MEFQRFQNISEFMEKVIGLPASERNCYIINHYNYFNTKLDTDSIKQLDLCFNILIGKKYLKIWQTEVSMNELLINSEILRNCGRRYKLNKKNRKSSSLNDLIPRTHINLIRHINLTRVFDEEADEIINNECPICLNNEIPTISMLWFNCNHCVCLSCAEKLLNKPRQKCPLCRETIRCGYIKHTKSKGSKT